MSSLAGGPITTVAPSTTAAALTSITTGLSPGEHGIVGYRMLVDDQVLNSLRWGTDLAPDARAIIPPSGLQPYPPFLGDRIALVTKAEFERSGFTQAHLRGGELVGYRTPAVLVHETARLVAEGEPVVYAYYDGVDKVAHEYGLGTAYDAELAFADRLVGDLLAELPSGTTLVVTADHGQVDCGDRLVRLSSEVLGMCTRLSGEGRFRWLHTAAGRRCELADAATAAHGDRAWVRTIDQILDEAWFGPGDVGRCAGSPGRCRAPAVRPDRLRRSRRFRALCTDRTARLAHLGRDARPLPRCHRLIDRSDRREPICRTTLGALHRAAVTSR